MTDLVIIAIVLAAAGIGVSFSIRHFKGKGGCCGGGEYTPRKKRLSGVLYQRTFRVEGMHCEHCKARVEKVVGDIRGVAGKVNLKKGELVVSYAQDVEDEQIISRIQRAGYTAARKE